MFFEIETGKVVDSTSLPSLHVGDGHIHFWYGPFMYSFANSVEEFLNFLQGKNTNPFFSIKPILFCEESVDRGEKTILIDSGLSRFGFLIKTKHIPSLIKYLKKVNEENVKQDEIKERFTCSVVGCCKER